MFHELTLPASQSADEARVRREFRVGQWVFPKWQKSHRYSLVIHITKLCGSLKHV